MFRRVWFAAVLAGLVCVALAKTVVCDIPGSDYPTVAAGSSCNLVVWRDSRNPVKALYAARVSPNLTVLDHNGFLVAPVDRTNDKFSVASDGTDFLVVWSFGTMSPNLVGYSLVDHLGNVTGPFPPITQGPNYKMYPTAAFRASTTGPGQCYLVVWEDRRNGEYNPDLYGARVTKEGVLLDQDGFLISSGPPSGWCWPSVASDGDRFMVVWNEWNCPQPRVRACFVEADRTVGNEFTVFDAESPYGIPDVAFDATSQSYQVIFGRSLGIALEGRTYDRWGLPLSDPFVVDPTGPVGAVPRIAAGTGHFLTVWGDGTTPTQVHARRLMNGQPVGDEQNVCPQPASAGYPDVSSTGAPFLVVWNDDEVVHHAISADTVSFWQQHFYTNTPEATAFNQGRHIALDPVTGYLHVVYEDAGEIYYSYSTDQGQHWWARELVGAGQNACVVCEGQGPNPVWVSYLDLNGPGQVFTKARLGPGQWATFPVCPANAHSQGAPSMSICHAAAGPIDEPAVYVTYGTFENNQSSILFGRVGLLTGVTQRDTVAGPTGFNLYTPTIATTPGDVIHVAWQEYHLYLGFHRIFYRQYLINAWQNPEPVSVTTCEPAYYPSVEAYGDRTYATWKVGLEPSVPGEVWRAWRNPWLPPWTDRLDLSRTTTASDYPQQATHWACAWQDPVSTPGNPDIWGDILDQNIAIRTDDPPSTYPNIAAEWSAPGGILRFRLHTVWTSVTQPGDPAPFEVLYQQNDFVPQIDGFDGFTYYDCGVGDSVKSPYCLARDGFARWRNYKVDFGHKSLRYRLPFLNPNYDYKLRAVLYQTSKDTWQQTFESDSVRLAQVQLRPLVPETVLVDIPRELYSKDCQVTLDINKLVGQYAAVAELRLYECFPYKQGQGGDQSAPVVVAAPATRVSLPRPSLVRDATTISYTVAIPERVSLVVYDAQGRLVRHLTTGMCARGSHSACWDARDDAGRRVPAGAYVIRIETESFSQTRKVVLTR